MHSVSYGRSPLSELFKHLSVLRARGANLLWNIITFSNRLVELRLQSINGYDSESFDFLQAPNSAPELRDLKIISVISFPDRFSDSPPPSPKPIKCPIPKLQTLLLEDLGYNVLQIIQNAVGPGTYQTTLRLDEKATHIHVPRQQPEIVGVKDLCKVLKCINVGKLVLQGEWQGKMWFEPSGLHSVLESLPALKPLIMSDWKFRKDDLLALARPRPVKKTSTKAFPKLTELYVENAQMLDIEPLRNIVTSHSLQKWSLSGCVAPPPDVNDSGSDDDDDVSKDNKNNSGDEFKDALGWHYFGNNDTIIKWLKSKVALFHLGDVSSTESKGY
ncbi:hypothetical protein B0J17DRAFT_678455 [Rhizoctonia solani]|nr:hypothetical protein B0J17DRAFT_678455 [Rhizoctonia solani]